jgi:hypothetical protein
MGFGFLAANCVDFSGISKHTLWLKNHVLGLPNIAQKLQKEK